MKQKKNSTCGTFEKMMDLYVCGMLTETDQLHMEAHTGECPACLRLFDGIKETYQFIDSKADTVPAHDWDTSWRIIRKQVFETAGRKIPSFGFRIGWTLAGAAAVFLVGILVGVYLINSPYFHNADAPCIQRGQAEGLKLLRTAFHRHIEDTKPVIIQYANYDDAEDREMSLSPDREIAAQLLAQNRLLQGKLAQLSPAKQRALGQLMEELELILTEISNLSEGEPENIALVKELIRIKGVLPKTEVFHFNEEIKNI
ncbi:MAG: zf-HC2 domain-containing protein [bacterium]|nr:zf-HC2 domain-containing protein [bacterium]